MRSDQGQADADRELAKLIMKAAEHASALIADFQAMRDRGFAELKGLRLEDWIDSQRFLLGILKDPGQQ